MADAEKMPDPRRTKAFRELCKLAGKAVCTYGMIRGGERILVGVSGGKDSLTLAHVLWEMKRKSPVPFSLSFATFDPGFPEFGLEKLRRYAADQQWDLQVISLPVQEILQQGKRATPCVLCSRLRRGMLYKLCRELGCTHLALGQHLDDAIASFFMSVTRGQGITTMGPNVPSDSGDVRIIRPLITAPESLIAEAAEAFSYPAMGKCAYHNDLQDGDRIFFRQLTDRLTERIPNLRSQMLHSFGKLEAEYLFDGRFAPWGKAEEKSGN